MKTSTILTLSFCFYAFSIFAQHHHEELEELFHEKGFAVFEYDLGLTQNELQNQRVQELVDSEYNNFQRNIRYRLDKRIKIDYVQFEVEYEALVKSTRQQIDSFNQFESPNPVYPPKVINGPCVNMDFEQGTLNGWTSIRAAALGATIYSFQNPGLPVNGGPGSVHFQIMGAGIDPVTGISTLNPLGGSYSLRLGDGIGTGKGATRLKQTFLVDNTNSLYTYSYAVIFESPINHPLNNLPYFTVRVFDEAGNNVPCGEYSVIATAANTPNYSTITPLGEQIVYYKDWETILTNLSNYIGQNVTIEFTTGDCAESGHYGYAYIDASCTRGEIITSSDAICSGDAAVLTAPSGVASYLWNTGETTQTITVTSSGNYSCTLYPFQAGGCEIFLDIDILDGQSPTSNFVTNDLVVCVNDAIDFTDLSTIPLPDIISNYRWDFGDGTITPLSNGTVTGVINTTGSYTAPSHTYTNSGVFNVELYVESVKGCSNNIIIPVTIKALPTIEAGLNQTVCEGTAVTLNGTATSGYVWDNGVISGVPFIQSVGTVAYHLSVVDVNGCQNTDTVSVTVHPLPIVNAGLNQTFCEGPMVTLSGAGAVSYSWNNGLTDGIPFYQAIGTTNYTVTGTDINGCEDTDIVAVTVHPLPIVNAGLSQILCEGLSVTLYGVGAVSYVWDNAVVDGIPFLQDIGTITYTVIGTDANGCENTDTVSVTVNPNPIVNAGLDKILCEGPMVTLAGTGAVDYVWNNTVVNGIPFLQSAGTTTYTVHGTDINGCEDSDTVIVTVNPLPTVSAGLDQILCEGPAVTLSGLGAVNYSWDNGVVNSISFIQNFGTITYTVIGTDANGCQNTDEVEVTVNPSITVNAGLDQILCEGLTITLFGSGATDYFWDNGVTNGVPFLQSVGTTTYTVIGTDANGCENTDTLVVTVNPLPIVNAGLDQTFCEGLSVILDGSGASDYVWDNMVVNGIPFLQSAGTTTYTVLGTDINGCEDSDTVIVTINSLPTVNAGLDQTFCEGSTVTLNGSGAMDYVWDNGVINGIPFSKPIGTTSYTVIGTDINGCKDIDMVNVTIHSLPIVNAGIDQTFCEGPLATLTGAGADEYLWDNGVLDTVPFLQVVGTTTYTVIGTDVNGCENIDTVAVTVNPLPTVNAGLDQILCEGSTITLAGSGAVSYIWDNGVVDAVPFSQGVGTIIYKLIGTDVNGCEDSDEVEIIVYPLPIVNAGLDQTFCEGPMVTLTGSGAVDYVWDNGIVDGISFLQSVGSTTYTVIGTDINGCKNTDTVVVIINSLPIVNAGLDQTFCEGPTVTLSGLGAVNYIWDNGIIDGISFIQAVGTTTYTVIGTDINGCQNSDDVSVVINPNPIINAGLDQVLCDYEWITLAATGAPNLVWDNGITDNISFQQAVGTINYTVTGTLSTGCFSTDQVVVVVLQSPNVTAQDVIICEGEPAVLVGNGAITYQWSGGVINDQPFYPNQTQNYTVTGTAANGCIVQAQATVTVNPVPIVDFEVLNAHLTTINTTTGFDNLSIGAVSYEWNFGDGSPINTQFEPTHTFPEDVVDEYSIELTGYSEFGCVNQAIKQINIPRDYLIYVPNAFTPDGDQFNNVFKPVMTGFDEQNYAMYIFNRWGEIVFESHDMEVGWDGTFQVNNAQVQDGIFTWKIEAKLKDTSDFKVFVGHVFLFR